MLNNEDPIEILTPSAAMLPVVEGLKSAFERLARAEEPQPQARYWEELDVVAFGRDAARIALRLRGWEPWGDVNPLLDERGLYHRLSAELNIISHSDLAERFKQIVNGRGLASQYRRIEEAPTLKDLLKNDIALGWAGMELFEQSHEATERLKRERMFADYFRGVLSWPDLRALDLAEGAALIVEALAVEMIDEEEAAPYFSRITGETMLRFSSRRDFARSLLAGLVFSALEAGEAEALATVKRECDRLLSFIAGPWTVHLWPRPKTGEPLPDVWEAPAKR